MACGNSTPLASCDGVIAGANVGKRGTGDTADGDSHVTNYNG